MEDLQKKKNELIKQATQLQEALHKTLGAIGLITELEKEKEEPKEKKE